MVGTVGVVGTVGMVGMLCHALSCFAMLYCHPCHPCHVLQRTPYLQCAMLTVHVACSVRPLGLTAMPATLTSLTSGHPGIESSMRAHRLLSTRSPLSVTAVRAMCSRTSDGKTVAISRVASAVRVSSRCRQCSFTIGMRKPTACRDEMQRRGWAGSSAAAGP